MEFTCPYCGYTAKETAFLEFVCPACCCDLETGKRIPAAIPTVFHYPSHESHNCDDEQKSSKLPI